jgi:FdhD protein
VTILVKDREAFKWREGSLRAERDQLAVEEPLEIRLGGRRFTLTMRTPGHDEELAAGFLFAEGFVNSRSELGEVRRIVGPKGEPDPNAIDVILSVPAEGMRERLKRNFIVSSSCGVCGKTSIESIQRRITPIDSPLSIPPAVVVRLAPVMRAAQQLFETTGGLHAAALFRFEPAKRRAGDSNGGAEARGSVELCVVREDVGRHNAVDKVIGYALMRGLVPLGQFVLMVSGRLSFEIVQKAAAAGIPILAAVSAPSSLAVELGDEVGITLVGFLRDSTFNVYTHPERIADRSQPKAQP